MDNRLKAGIISGLIAGFILGLAATIADEITASLGLWEPWWRDVIGLKSIWINIPLGLIWGVILGLIYSRVYIVIPGKGVIKGLIYGLIIFVITPLRLQTFNLAYGWSLLVAGGISAGFLTWISYGLVLGFLYEILQYRYDPSRKELKVKKYDMKEGFYPGVIAGLLGGMAAGGCAVLGPAAGLWEVIGGPATYTIAFWLSQAGAHIFVNMFWDIIFGLMFTKVYSLVPNEGTKKGLIYGLIVYLITTFQMYVWWISTAAYHNFWYFIINSWNGFILGAAQFITFGLVLGYLYKPTK